MVTEPVEGEEGAEGEREMTRTTLPTGRGIDHAITANLFLWIMLSLNMEGLCLLCR